MLCGKIEGKRSRGRRRPSHGESLNVFLTEKQMPYNRVIKLADDRIEWRTMIVNACNKSDTRRRRDKRYFVL